MWTQTTVSGNLINAVNVLMRDAFLKNSITDRIIPNFYVKKPEANFVKSDGTAFTIEKTQFTGDSIDVIFDNICETLGIGYRILFGYQMRRLYGDSIDVLNPNNNTWVSHTLSDYDLVFELYLGVDRSYVQNDRPYVVFSPGFDNIINTNYIDSVNLMKNVTLVLGEDQGNVRKRLIVGCGQGLDRRELYTDARDLRSSDYGTAAKYQQAMKQRGLEKLYENSRITSYEGEVEALRSFIYGEDFFMGDVVQISNEYGINGNARVVEWVRSESETGLEVYPTFSGIQIINDDIQEDDE